MSDKPRPEDFALPKVSPNFAHKLGFPDSSAWHAFETRVQAFEQGLLAPTQQDAIIVLKAETLFPAPQNANLLWGAVCEPSHNAHELPHISWGDGFMRLSWLHHWPTTWADVCFETGGKMRYAIWSDKILLDSSNDADVRLTAQALKQHYFNAAIVRRIAAEKPFAATEKP